VGITNAEVPHVVVGAVEKICGK